MYKVIVRVESSATEYNINYYFGGKSRGKKIELNERRSDAYVNRDNCLKREAYFRIKDV